MKNWSLVFEGFRPEKERLRESLCTLGNGYFATRGAAPEVEAGPLHYPGTYLAGGYDRQLSTVAGREVENEDLVNLPNWLPLKLRFDDSDWLSFDGPGLLEARQELDLLGGVLLRKLRFEDEKGRRLVVRQRRLVHMRHMHLCALETTLEAENWTGALLVHSALDGTVTNQNVARYSQLEARHLRPLEARELEGGGVFLKVETAQSQLRVALAARTTALEGKAIHPVPRQAVIRPGYVGEELVLQLTPGRSMTVQKLVALYTSRDHASSECGLEAASAISKHESFEELFATQRITWSHLWRRFDVRVETERGVAAPDPLALRLHVFHLLQTASPNTIDLDVGVPARGLHGEAYRGHVFWDELFIFPFLNLRIPEVTRSLLRYRFRRLPAAREAARQEGLSGALFPWQSGSNGREESQRLHLNPRSGRWIDDNSHLQRHVNAAIAFNVWQHYQATGDLEFLSFGGAEMLLEIARLFSSLSTFDKERGRYEIRGVVGPDEYHDRLPGSDHPGLDNNTYTNVMAVWVLTRALEVLSVLPEVRAHALTESLRLSAAELHRWEDISRRMRLVFHEDGVLSQFEGYERLEEFDWERYRARYGDVHRLDRILEAEGDSANRYKASKQADVLMLFYLFSSAELADLFGRLGYPFEKDTIRRNIQYYEPRTSHGSTLSRVVHAWVLSRMDRAGSLVHLTEALRSDLLDIQGGTTEEGIHLGAMAGTVDLVQRAYTGLVTRDEVLWLEPALPEEVRCLHLHLHYRGQALDLELSHHHLRVSAVNARVSPIRLGVEGRVYALRHGEKLELPLTAEERRPEEGGNIH